MRISMLRINGFRSLCSVEMPLSDYTILIGRNNSGKSSVLLALKLLFEGTKQDLADVDFYTSDTQSADEILLEAELEGVRDYLSLCSETHRFKIAECIDEDNKLRIRRSASRSPLSLEKLMLWQPKKNQWGLPTGIENALKQLLPEIIFIEAFKDPSDETQPKSSATLGKILKQIVEPMSENIKQKISDTFDSVNQLLNVDETGDTPVDKRPEELQRIEQRIRQHMQAVFEEADVRLKFRLPDVRDLLGLAQVELRDRGVWTPPEGKGQGFQRMLYLALLRTLAEELREAGGGNSGGSVYRPFLLLFEEPEAFLHPSLQREIGDILENISKTNQVVVATHSALVVTPQRIQNVMILRQTATASGDSYATRCFVPESARLPNHYNKQLINLLKYSSSAEFLFADRVLVVEGPSDRALLEACWYILRKSQDTKTVSVELAIVEAGGKAVVPVWIRYIEAMGIPSCGLVDLDFLWEGAEKCFDSNDEDLKQFTGKFWELASEKGLYDSGGERCIKSSKKAEGFDLIRNDLEEQAGKLRQRLRKENKIWVLDGEIERYFNLSSSSKGSYTNIIQQVRGGDLPVPPEISKVLEWAAGLQDSDSH